jgi:transcriptional regulator with XRE-family HTH domain
MLAPVTGPTIRRRQLGIELRRLRDAAGATREQAATALGCSPMKITYMETGRNAVRKPELIVMLQFYGADKEHLDTLEQLRQEASRRGWWSTARLPEWLSAYVGLEADATSLRAVELELIPGLLQTEQYAREVHIRAGHMTAPEEVDRRVAARMRRQARLADPDQLPLAAVVSEAALQRCRHAIGAEQLQHLLAQAQRPNIDVRILPFEAGPHGMGGTFTLLGFPDEVLPDIGYQEYAVGGQVIDDQETVARLDKLYSDLRSQALGSDESLAVIAEFADRVKAERGTNAG